MSIQSTETETTPATVDAMSPVETVLDDMRGIRSKLIGDYLANRTPATGASAVALTEAIDAGTIPDNEAVRSAIKAATVAYNRDNATALRAIDRLVSVLTANALAAVAQVAGIADEHSLAQVALTATRRATQEILREQDERAEYRLVWFDRNANDAQETGIAGKSIGEIHSHAVTFTQEHMTGKWRSRSFAVVNRHNVPVVFLHNGKIVPRPERPN